ncbi:hypothetical protein ACXR2T_08085 [Leucobacter sp. HY1910]
MEPTTDLHARVRVEAAIAVKHMGITAYAQLLGVTVPALKQLQREAGRTQAVAWAKLSTPVLRALFDAFITGGEVASRFCSRHGYSVSGFSAAMKEQWPEEWAMAVEDKQPTAANRYRIGRALEQRVKLHLTEAGYFVVRSAGSHSAADLVALKDGTIWLVQCKRAGALPPSEWNALITAAEQAGGHAIMVENPHSGTVNWWKLTSRKTGRGTGTKEQVPAPVKLTPADMFTLKGA